ncbi:hypothetical protein TRICI_000638 [Trichomonascus ciferrii]|uniref:DNA replication factor Cdt1 C-terminal domain-containing protein n=1 Tax=Trichomonascus ciferrii TaxID=44093 RepID=A0A642VCW9_9ASCO|nr:hypothetical protein TRICI_000638 [Trichomonascus ciferrii]
MTKQRPSEVHNVGEFLNKGNINGRSNALETAFEKKAGEFGDMMADLMTKKGYLNKNVDDNRNEESLCLFNFYLPHGRDATITVNENRSFAVKDGMMAVLPGPLLESASEARYVFSTQQPKNLTPYFYSHRLGSEKDEGGLCQLVEAIDSSLVYYYATSSLGSITFTSLQKRVRQSSGLVLNLEHIQQILTVEPSLYVISAAGETFGVKANGLPLEMIQRRKRFRHALKKWKNKTIPLSQLPELTKTSKKRSASQTLLQDPIKIQKKAKVAAANETKKTGTLLERIRAKEAAAKNDPSKDERVRKEKYENYIKSQLPRVISILLSLRSKAYTFDELLKVFSDSLTLRLSPEESRDVIHRLSTDAPTFCSIVKAGSLNAVKICHSGWDHQSLKNKLCI